MLKITVLYGHPTDPDAFDTYYAETHTPLVQKTSNITRFEVAKVLPGPDKPPYYFIAELYFEDQAHMRDALRSPEGRAMNADVPNFATGGVTNLISEVK